MSYCEKLNIINAIVSFKQNKFTKIETMETIFWQRNKMVSSDNFKYTFVLLNIKKEFKYISLKQILEFANTVLRL